MEAPTCSKTQSASTCLLNFQKFDYDNNADHFMVATALNSSPDSMSIGTYQKTHATRNCTRRLAAEQQKGIAMSQQHTTTDLKIESNGNDRMKGVDTKANEKNDRKTRSSTDKLLLCPFSDKRVYAIINGDIQFVSLIPTTLDFQKFDGDNKADHFMIATALNNSPDSKSICAYQRSHATRSGTRRLAGEQQRAVAISQPTDLVKCESIGNDQLKGVGTKEQEINERKTRSSTDKLLLCPFSDTRVYAILNGDIQFVSLIPTTPFLESIHAISRSRKVLELTHKHAAIDRYQTKHLDFKRTGQSQSLHSFVNHGCRQGKNHAQIKFSMIQQICVTSNGKDHEGEKCTRRDDRKRLTTSSTQCTMSDDTSGDETGSNDAIDMNCINSYDDRHSIKQIDTRTPIMKKPEGYLSRLRTRLPRLTMPLKPTGNDEDLDETTLSLLHKVALKDLRKCHRNKIRRFCCERLDEEEIESFMLRTARAANDRVNHAVVLRADVKSEEYNRDAIMFRTCLAEAEAVILWQDYFRRIVRETQRYVIHNRVKDKEGTKKFDKRTIHCTKRRVATYLRWNREIEARKQPGYRNIANFITRNDIRHRERKKKQQSRDYLLEILFQAVETLLPAKEETCMGQGTKVVMLKTIEQGMRQKTDLLSLLADATTR